MTKKRASIGRTSLAILGLTRVTGSAFIFPVPPIRSGGWRNDREHGDHEHGMIHEVVRRHVGNRNYRRRNKWGEGQAPRLTPSRRPRLRARLRRVLRLPADIE